MDLSERIAFWIREKVEEAKANGTVLGLSGGVDSTVVGILCKRAFPDTTLGLILPCFSSPLDLKHAEMVAEKFDIPIRKVDLTSVFLELYRQLEEYPYSPLEKDVVANNLKPRLRMTTLYYFANKLNYLVVGTGNKSELTMGYFTKYGDGGVDLLPLGGLLKTQVRQLAREFGIPEEIIKKVPSAGLWEGQTDEGEMGISYVELDRIIAGIEANDFTGCDLEKVNKIKTVLERTKHKREMPPIFRP